MIKQKQSKSDLATYYQQNAREQATQIKKLETRLQNAAADITELTQENERLRIEKRQYQDKWMALTEEREAVTFKLKQ